MEIKVICDCAAKFKFEIEPVNGRMPVPVNCPVCGKDATANANFAIAEKLAAAPPMQVQPQPPATRPPVVAIASAAPAPAIEEGVARCAKHPNEISAAECAVCGKAICHRCMEQFGFLCSTYCKGQAEARKIHVPVFKGQVHQKLRAEGRSHNLLIVATFAIIAAVIGAYVWYWFVGSRPKLAFKVETEISAPFMRAQWFGDDKIFGVTPLRVAMFSADDGKELWSTDLPKGEIKGTKGMAFDAEWEFDYEPTVAVANGDIWVGLPRRVLRLEGKTGKKKQELMLPRPANDYRVSDSHMLAVSMNDQDDGKTLTRINFSNGQMESQSTPSSSGARRVVATIKQAPGVANTSLRNLKPGDPEFEEFNTVSYYRDPDFVFTGLNVAHLTRKVAEQRIAVQAGKAAKTGPLIIDKGNMRASQGNAAAIEFLGAGGEPDTHIDESIYEVTIRRYFGAGGEWTGPIAGRPYFFSQPTVDLLAGGKTLIVFDKNNRKLWEKKLNYPIFADMSEDGDSGGPALEINGKLIFCDAGEVTAFDLKKGDVLWRVEAVGASGMTADKSGNLYVSATSAIAQQIKGDGSIGGNADPELVKISLSTGKVAWRAARSGSEPVVAGEIVYTQHGQFSGIDMVNEAIGGKKAQAHWRLYRIDPETGKQKWEYYREGPPESVHAKEKRILLRYKDQLRFMKHL